MVEAVELGFVGQWDGVWRFAAGLNFHLGIVNEVVGHEEIQVAVAV